MATVDNSGSLGDGCNGGNRQNPQPRADDVWEGAEILSTYTRAQAIADGSLVDVSQTAYEAGILFAVALTRAVWSDYVEVPKGVLCQDEQGRLWDILWMFRCAAESFEGDSLLYKLHVRNDNLDRTPPLVTLQALCGPGDDGDPVITIMLPDED
jgi:hypothetical protein